MKNLKDIIFEKLKVSKDIYQLSFTFNELCDSILRFVNKNISTGEADKLGTEYIIKIYKLDYFKDNPLIIKNAKPIVSMFKLQDCKVGSICFNTHKPNYISCHTTGRSMTLKDKFAVDQSFIITEKTFSKIFNVDDLEKLYSILNEEN